MTRTLVELLTAVFKEFEIFSRENVLQITAGLAMFDCKKYRAFYVETEDTYHVLMCPFVRYNFDADKQAAVFFRGNGFDVYAYPEEARGTLKLKDNLPHAWHHFALSAQAIKLFLRAAQDSWSFKDYKLLHVPKSRIPPKGDSLWRTMAHENVRADKRREVKAYIPLLCLLPD